MFVHLRLHTEYSVVDGTNRIAQVVRAAAENDQPALAITDLSNLFGAVKFYQAARKAGVKPILGAEIFLTGLGSDSVHRVVLLVQDHRGYLHLSELLSRGWLQGENKNQALIDWAWLREKNEGLILLSGAQAGPVGAALLQADLPLAELWAEQMAAVFDHRFYLELQRAGRKNDEAHVAATVQLAARMKLPVVATHPVQFAQAEDFEAHEARICIAEGEILANPRREKRFTPEQYFKSAEQMQELFADVPSALANTVEIARRCNLNLTLGQAQLPDFPLPEGHTEDSYLHLVCQQGLEERLQQLYPDAAEREKQRPRYAKRLEFEIGIILQMGFPGYFLIVSDFIQWAKANACPVGPGRGSGAGSLVAYALKITDLDPLRFNLLFERFLNPERVSMPDFDVDFCQANRDRVIEYVKSRYGRDAVSQIATFGTMAARAAIRDVGRVLDMGYSFCDGISKLVPNKPGKPVTLQYPPEDLSRDEKEKYALAAEPELARRIRDEEEVRTLIELAQKLEGLTRNVGMHAGGVLIAPGRLTDFGPLYLQPGSTSAVSQYDKDDVEAVGLVKFDFLGLATLTILELAKNFIRASSPAQKDFVLEDIPEGDAPTFELFQQGRTEAVFQFESRGMQGMLRDAQPTRFEDLIALNAMYRPGPMEHIPSFVARKHGRESVHYPHPLVKDILAETYGIMVYQEQVMQTAQILGGYSLGAADLLRRAMGKKKPEEMARQREIFRRGASEKGIDEKKADEVFDLMEKFAGYGFNKSHAAAYSLLAYQTAWLKVHYPAEFFSANMTVEMDNTDKLKALYDDALREGLSFAAPDVNQSVWRFEPAGDKRVRYGLGAIKGTGRQAIEAIVQARDGHPDGDADQRKPFASLFDFCCRIDRSRISRRVLEALVRAGAMDSLHANRATLMASVPLAMEFAAASEANKNQGGLFDDLQGSSGSGSEEPELQTVPPWNVREQLTLEKTAIGFFLTGHLFDAVEHEVRQFAALKLADARESRDLHVFAGIISDLRIINGHRGRLALFRLDDKSASIDARADQALIEQHRELLRDDELIIVQAKVMPDRFSGGLQLQLQRIWDLPAARCHFGQFLRVAVGPTPPDVRQLLMDFPPRSLMDEEGEFVQGLPIRLQVRRQHNGTAAQMQLQLGQQARFFPSDAALQRWSEQADAGRAVVVYR